MLYHQRSKRKYVSSVSCCYCLSSHARSECIRIRPEDKQAEQFYECFGDEFKRECSKKIYAFIGVHHLCILERWKLVKQGVLDEQEIRVALDHCYAYPLGEDGSTSVIENEEELSIEVNMDNNNDKKQIMETSSSPEKEIAIDNLVCASQPLISMATFCYNCKNIANYKTRSEGLVKILYMNCKCGKRWTWYSSENIKLRRRDKSCKFKE